MKAQTIKGKQLVIAQWDNPDTGHQQYSTFILGEDGGVYRYDPKCQGWIPWPMRIADCRLQHKGKR